MIGHVLKALLAVMVLGLISQDGYQRGYDTAKAECKPIIKREIPLKNMTHKQAVRNIQWHNRDRGIIK